MQTTEDYELYRDAALELDHVISRLRALPRDEQRRIVMQLDPEMRIALYERVKGRLSPAAQAEVDRAALRKDENYAPVDDDELHQFVLEECGHSIPRQAVCIGHCAPFEAFSDAYFSRFRDALWVGNRGSGKTQQMGDLHAVNARTKKGWSGVTVGARKGQAFKAYGFFSAIASRPSWKKFLARGRCLMGGTPFKNGSSVEILTGTIEGVNSPHPVMTHWDEVELLRDGVYEEGLNMAQSANGHPAMNLLTSSWKKPRGFVTEIIKQAREQGVYKVYRWCTWETTKPCPHDCSQCPFRGVVRGTIEGEGGTSVPRTFEWACKRDSPFRDDQGRVLGKLKFSNGFIEQDDTVRRFQTLSQRVWESQQESRRPSAEGLAYDWDETRYDVSGWEFDPDNGPIKVSIDPGGVVPSSAGFYQRLKVEVEAPIGRVPVHALVRFAEIYQKNLGATELGLAINRKRIELGGGSLLPVEAFYMDAAARMASRDLATLSKHGAGLEYTSIWTIRKKGYGIEESIQWVKDDLIDRKGDPPHCLLYADIEACPGFTEEIGQYELDDNGRPVKDQDDHAMDDLRYLIANEHIGSRSTRTGKHPVAVGSRVRAVAGVPGHRTIDRNSMPDLTEYGASPVAVPSPHRMSR